MIKTENGKVEINGNTIEVLSDLSLIIHCLHDDIFIKDMGTSEDEAKEMILHAVETGFIPPEELHKQNEGIKEKLGDVLENVVDLLEMLVKGGHKE